MTAATTQTAKTISDGDILRIQTNLTLSQISQRILRLDGRPYSLKNYPMFESIMNSRSKRRLMRSGRQVSKTTVIAADMVTNITITPNISVIYCNSSQSQMSAFSQQKLRSFLLHSPLVYKSMFRGEHIVDNVRSKVLSNNSQVILSFFSDAADRVRGSSGSRIYLDEVQDMLWDAMVDAQECLAAARDPRYVYAGTSKSLNTPLEFLWQESTQKEWIIRCSGCNAWNRPSLENIGLKGLICKKCGKALDTFQGQWVAANPETETNHPFVDGYWIPQIIMPMHCCSDSKWAELLTKRNMYSPIKFDNEVMGLPNGEGDSPITREMLEDICLPNLSMLDRICKENADGARYIAAGIDWGGGGEMGVSRTVLSIYACYPEQPMYKKIFGKIYDDGEPAAHVEDIAMWLVRFGVHMICGDHGGGNFAMSMLSTKIPVHMRLIPVMYSDASAPFRWDESARRYTVNRTAMIDAFFMDIKSRTIRTFCWEQFKVFAADILNIKQEVLNEESGKTRRVWRHSPKCPDDSLHSMLFGWFACRVLSGRMEFSVVV